MQIFAVGLWADNCSCRAQQSTFEYVFGCSNRGWYSRGGVSNGEEMIGAISSIARASFSPRKRDPKAILGPLFRSGVLGVRAFSRSLAAGKLQALALLLGFSSSFGAFWRRCRRSVCWLTLLTKCAQKGALSNVSIPISRSVLRLLSRAWSCDYASGIWVTEHFFLFIYNLRFWTDFIGLQYII